MKSALNAIIEGFLTWPVWLWFARQDIKSRYRGSMLGPLWLVLNLGILVVALSVIYATIFGLKLDKYMSYVTTGFIAWWFVSGTLMDSCTAFTANSQIIRNLPLPIGVHVMRVLMRNTLLLLHNMIVYVVVVVAFGIWPNVNTLLALVGFGLVALLLFSLGISLAIACARFRDIPHIVSSIVQVMVFVTPIMFFKDMLQNRSYIADVNPFYHMIEAIRAPLLGDFPEQSTWVFLVCANLITFLFATWLVKSTGHRVPYLV